MKEKYLIGGPGLQDANIGIQFDEDRGELIARSAVNHSDRLDSFMFDKLLQGHPTDSYLQRSGIHMRRFYRYFLPCDRLGFRHLLTSLEAQGFTAVRTRKLWRD